MTNRLEDLVFQICSQERVLLRLAFGIDSYLMQLCEIAQAELPMLPNLKCAVFRSDLASSEFHCWKEQSLVLHDQEIASELLLITSLIKSSPQVVKISLRALLLKSLALTTFKLGQFEDAYAALKVLDSLRDEGVRVDLIRGDIAADPSFNDLRDSFNIARIAQTYVFFHEIGHIKLRYDSSFREGANNILKSALQITDHLCEDDERFATNVLGFPSPADRFLALPPEKRAQWIRGWRDSIEMETGRADRREEILCDIFATRNTAYFAALTEKVGFSDFFAAIIILFILRLCGARGSNSNVRFVETRSLPLSQT
jgi:hypothetical protein